ncbi:hypothetical protein [Dyadobacter crusticola]|uniref:hypothetical protein n=1 Tax=Dyadobacter crusticola TaxID=292407 RepID=UPI0004E1271C|nr:hypothetical protein [Dyadobacter crusticola]
MAKLIFIFLRFGFFWNNNIEQRACQQSPIPFEFIRDFPIKIDGGCSFYTFDTTSLSNNKFILVVSAHKTAFFQSNEKFVYLDHVSRKPTTNGYVDNFEGSGYRITIDVNKTKRIMNTHTEVAGTLRITKKQVIKTLAIHGINEEFEVNR